VSQCKSSLPHNALFAGFLYVAKMLWRLSLAEMNIRLFQQPCQRSAQLIIRRQNMLWNHPRIQQNRHEVVITGLSENHIQGTLAALLGDLWHSKQDSHPLYLSHYYTNFFIEGQEGNAPLFCRRKEKRIIEGYLIQSGDLEGILQ
jgi:hypothetical protein